MKQDTSIGIPTFWEISMIGTMSAATVRAAQLGRIFSLPRTISWARRVTVSTTWGPAPGQADVGRVDAEGLHEVQDPDLLVDRGALDGRRLQAVPQRLVVELHAAARGVHRAAGAVPVVDEVGVRRVQEDLLPAKV